MFTIMCTINVLLPSGASLACSVDIMKGARGLDAMLINKFSLSELKPRRRHRAVRLRAYSVCIDGHGGALHDRDLQDRSVGALNARNIRQPARSHRDQGQASARRETESARRPLLV